MWASLQENPYQVKGKRFRRTHNENEMQSELSIEKGRTLVAVKSSHELKCAPYDPFPSSPKSDAKVESRDARRVGGKDAGSLEKRQLRRRRQQQNQQSQLGEREASMVRAINERERRICELEHQLRMKQQENRSLSDKLAKFENLQKQSLDLEGELREQLSKMQGSHAEEAYSLRQAVKRLEMEVSCLNRKWSVDFDRMLKEKELECRSLREKYTGLLRAKRQVSRQSSIVTQNPSSSSASQCSFLQGDRYQNELLDLSSFQLSTEDALDY